MGTIFADLVEIRLEVGERLSGRVRLDRPLRIEPGQYLLAQPVGDCTVLPQPIFVSGGADRLFDLAARLPPGWLAGARLALRGPLGCGFRLPPTARKVALAALDGCPERLLPLARRSLAQGGDVTLYGSDHLPERLPLAVEALPLSQLHQSLTWADYLALDAPLDLLGELPDRLGLTQGQRCPCPAQVLVVTPMPCGGVAECGVCAVHTTRGWRLACKDGPVFDLEQLLEGR